MRYTYPRFIYISTSDPQIRHYKYGQIKNKGEIHVHVSFPYINAFHFRPESEGSKINAGFMGLSVGLDYYHSNRQFLNLGITGVLHFLAPVPVSVSRSGEYEMMRSVYINLSNNHRLKRFTLGYGLSCSKNTWELRYADTFNPPPPTRDPVNKTYYALGLFLPIHYQLAENLHIGMIYRPSFYRPELIEKFKYEHIISLEITWKITLNDNYLRYN